MAQEDKQDKVFLSLSYKDLKVDFSGSPEEVLHLVNAFIANELPSFNLAKKLSLNYGASELVEGFQAYVKITPEGPRIMGDSKLSDKELVAMQLVAQKIAFETGNAKIPFLSLSELQSSTALNPKSLSSRLSELAKVGHVVREENGDPSGFRISTQGIKWLVDVLGKKAKKPHGS